MVKEEFCNKMKDVSMSSNIGETYNNVYGEKWGYVDWYQDFTFEDIKKMFDYGHNLPFNQNKDVYSKVILMFLYLQKNSPKLIRGKPMEQYFQELEDSLPLENWKKMLRVISKEKGITDRIIGGKGEEYDLSTRPIYFNKTIMSIHIMDSWGIKTILKMVLLDSQDLFSGSFIKYFPQTNRLYLSGNRGCLNEWDEYNYNRYTLHKEYKPIMY